MGFGLKVLVQGERACFTRPEMKAERVSYDVITPSAARGLLESVYWKPAIAWRIDAITVLNPIEFDTFRRNELSVKASEDKARKAMKAGRLPDGIDSSDASLRVQRQTVLLRDVAYLIEAHFEMTERADADDTPMKHYSIARRRLQKGQCFNQPYLGCREFAARFSLVEDDVEPPVSCYDDVEEKDLGYMLYDIDFEHGMRPIFFRAVMRRGRIPVAEAVRGVVS